MRWGLDLQGQVAAAQTTGKQISFRCYNVAKQCPQSTGRERPGSQLPLASGRERLARSFELGETVGLGHQRLCAVYATDNTVPLTTSESLERAGLIYYVLTTNGSARPSGGHNSTQLRPASWPSRPRSNYQRFRQAIWRPQLDSATPCILAVQASL